MQGEGVVRERGGVKNSQPATGAPTLPTHAVRTTDPAVFRVANHTVINVILLSLCNAGVYLKDSHVENSDFGQYVSKNRVFNMFHVKL